MMSSLLPTSVIFVATDPVDLRKAFDGLSTLVRQSLGQDPLSGGVHIFSNRQRNRLKILFWEPCGYCLCNRRLEEGTFRWPRPDAVYVRLNRQELALLLGWIDLKETRQRNWYRSVGSGD